MRSASRRLWLAFSLFLLPFVLMADYNAVDYYHAGLSLYRQKDYAQAEKYLRYAVKLDPTDWRTHQMLGQAYYFLNQKDKAAKEIGESLKLHPDNQPLRAFYNSLQPAPVAATPTLPASIATTANPSTSSVAGPGLPTAEISGPWLPVGAVGVNGAPLTSYVWDPAIDPYPLYTGSAMPLPKPQLFLLPSFYLTAAFELGFCRPIGNFYNGNDLSYTSIPLRLNYQLDQQISLVGGVEFWSDANYSSQNSYSGSAQSNSLSEAESFKVTPFTLGFSVHSLSKTLSFDGGFSLLGIIYQGSNYEDRKSSNAPPFNNSYESISTSTINGFTLGGVVESDLSLPLDAKNQFAIFLDGECYFAPDYDYAFALASGNQSNTNLNTNGGVTTTTSNFYNIHQEETAGFFGMSVGFGLRGGF